MKRTNLAALLASMTITAMADEVVNPPASTETPTCKVRREAGDGVALPDAPVSLKARRYSSLRVSDDAYVRVDTALADLARAERLNVGSDAEAVTLEFDSFFYVYTNKFNARLVRIPEYTQAQLTDKPTPSPEVENRADLLRIAGGALGLVRGWISPAFGSFMITGGAAPALFGSGKAPTRLFVPGKERFARGEQEVATTVRVLREGRAKEVLAVRCVLPGDEPPFRIDDLVSASWLKALEEVRGQARCYDPR